MTTPQTHDFFNLYARLQLLDVDRPELRLHEICPNRESCWQNARHRIPPKDKDWNGIARPWIGKSYERLRLLFLAINMNGSGGFDEAELLVQGACREIRDGHVRVRFGLDYKSYRGSMLYHRMGSYAWAFAESAGLVSPLRAEQRWPTPNEVADSFDLLSYTNHVKCSPNDDANSNTPRSQPTGAMWQHCGKHVLAEEMKLLQPKVVVVLGASDNFNNFRDQVLGEKLVSIGPPMRGAPSRVSLFKPSSGDTLVVKLPHPAAKGGCSQQLFSDLRCAAKDTRTIWFG